jgi:hypothetical protein
MDTFDGPLNGNGKENDDMAGSFDQGDRVGVLLGLGDGSLRFFKTPSLPPLFLGVPGGVCVWGCKECESTKSHAVKVVCLCEK